MNKNVLIVLAGGFLVAVLVAVLVQASLKGGSSSKSSGSEDQVQVLVAAHPIPTGKELSATDIKWQEWPESALFPGAIVREGDEEPTDVVKGKVRESIAEGVPLHRAYLIENANGSFMAASLGEGMRAVGIEVKPENIAGGFIGPGDYVDVVVTYKVTAKRDYDNQESQKLVNKLASETILENVRVLASGQTSTPLEDDSGKTKTKIAKTVTIEVNAEGAEKLALAAEMGTLTLALRRLGDESKIEESTLTTDTRSTKVLKKLADVQSGSGGASGIVRVYNGADIYNVPVREGAE